MSRVPGNLRMGGRLFGPDELLVMAIVNRTPDSFYDRGANYAFDAALDKVDQAVAEGADIIDIGGVRAAPGGEVSVDEELRRTVDFVGAVRTKYPEIVISVDTWRHQVAEEVCRVGADLINDSWGGVDERLAEVAAEYGAALLCAHTGGQTVRTRPHRVGYPDLMESVLRQVTSLATAAVEAGVHPESVIIDPAHDFGKNTHQSLEITRRLDEMVDTGWPVLVSVSNKDFVGESLNAPVDQRLFGSLAVAGICAWHGARIYRVHEVAETRQVIDMVSTIRGTRPPARTLRGLA